jgi:hypothetical protein
MSLTVDFTSVFDRFAEEIKEGAEDALDAAVETARTKAFKEAADHLRHIAAVGGCHCGGCATCIASDYADQIEGLDS